MDTPTTAGEPDAILKNAVDVVPREELQERLHGGPLRIKLGVDPTAPDIHLGHAVALKKLRQFQDLGHTVVLIIGDYTALVGDPSGRSKTRPVLAENEIESNTRTYLEQAFVILDRGKTEIRHNSEWLAPLSMADIIEITRATTVARILERDDFHKRYSANEPISLTELLYPLMQGYDSVVVEPDVELGGTDQLYNLLVGRQLMEFYGKKPQCVLTMPLLVGTDGSQKMSKSLGNYIGVTEKPEDVFGKAMTVPDAAMPAYYRLLLDREPPEGEPLQQKRELSRSLVRTLHGEEAVAGAESAFDAVSRRETPEDLPEIQIPGDPDGGVWVVDLITAAGFAGTNGEARRLIRGGAVRLGGEQIQDEKLSLPYGEIDGMVLQVGKRRYTRLVG
ncbi:tyrosine--tRNA ligase [Rubrobacter aplysinae]|uniref:tyrosine--tRNA ligase n=1 Tax=Rubrobacter aplysinae TaxID=909625 RepID=UPI00064C3AEB|nr:tyrosine--tRNA ligase [Rubrobacter aplysinae]